MDYGKWKEEAFSPRSLLLDPKNPRIPPRDKSFDQAELLSELVNHDNVYGLASSIVEHGFFPGESLIAFVENRKKIVLEGNRRLAACKLLLDPENAPHGYVQKFKRLSERFSHELIKKLPTFIAPSRSAATHIMVSRHTEVQIERWKAPMQAKFYYNLLTENGMTIDELAVFLNINANDLRKEIALHKMYSIACSFEYEEEIGSIVKNPRKFPVTTFKRVYESNPGEGFFHISIDSEGEIQGHIDKNEFKKGAITVISDIAAGDINSRSLNSDGQIGKYLDGLDADKRPDPSKGGSFTSESFLSEASAEAAKKKRAKKTAPKRRPRPTGLIPKAIKCNVENQRINNIVKELYDVSPARFGNAAAYLLRGLVEMSMRYHLDKIGELEKWKAEERAKLKKKGKAGRLPADWMPGLNDMINYFSNKSIIDKGPVAKAFNRAMKDSEGLFKMNLFAHNESYHPTEEKLRDIWSDIEEFMKIMLTEPESE